MNNKKELKKQEQIQVIEDRIAGKTTGRTGALDAQLLTLISIGESLTEQTELLRIIAKQEPKIKREPWYKKIFD